MTHRFEPSDPGGAAPYSVAFSPSVGEALQVELGLGRAIDARTRKGVQAILHRRVLLAGSLRALTPAELAALAPTDLERIDRIALEFGADALRRLSVRPDLACLPLFLATLTRPQGRALAGGALADARARTSGGLILAIEQVQDASAQALLVATRWLRPHSARIAAVLPSPGRAAFEAARAGGFDAAAITPPPGQDLSAFVTWLFDLVEAAEGFPLSLAELTPQQAALAARQGVAHLSAEAAP